MAGRPPSEKTFANMLRVAIKEAHEDGKDRLRAVADALVTKAISGDVPAIKEIADRLDGKVPQAIVGDGEYDPIDMNVRLDAERFTRAIADLAARSGTGGGNSGADS
jgi:hypothetical protein